MQKRRKKLLKTLIRSNTLLIFSVILLTSCAYHNKGVKGTDTTTGATPIHPKKQLNNK